MEAVETINGLTREAVGMALFKHSVDASLDFPAAENTHRYQDAHNVLYGYFIDGLSKDCISALSKRLGCLKNFASYKTVDALLSLYPELNAPSKYEAAASLVSKQRRIASHGVRPHAERFPAFERFTDDLKLCLEGLQELLAALERNLHLEGRAARRRNEAKESLPQIDKDVHSGSFLHKLNLVQGKTLERVEYGIRKDRKGVHGSDAMILHFSDGSILGVETGSNARNLSEANEQIHPEDLSVDFILTWVDPIKPNSLDNRN